MKTYVLTFLFTSSLSFAATPLEQWNASIQDLVREVETLDPNVKTHHEEWERVKKNLLAAPTQVESENGLKLSAQAILNKWRGLYVRVLDRQDAQYWALSNEELTLPRAWLVSKGPRWFVRYEHPQASDWKRGDAIMDKNFAPFSAEWQAKTTWELSLQSNPMKEARTVRIPVTKTKLGAWALDMMQSSSQVAVVNGKRLCFEKVWLFLSESVAQNLSSKLSAGTCDALLIDLRDSFGEGIQTWPSPKKAIPIAILVNHESREGSVALTKALKASAKTRVYGESTGPDRLPTAVKKLGTGDWMLLASAGGEGVKADQDLRDSFMYAGGFDDVREAATQWLKSTLDR